MTFLNHQVKDSLSNSTPWQAQYHQLDYLSSSDSSGFSHCDICSGYGAKPKVKKRKKENSGQPGRTGRLFLIKVSTSDE